MNLDYITSSLTSYKKMWRKTKHMKTSNLVWIGRYRGHMGFATATREYIMALLPHVPDLKIAPLEVLEEGNSMRKYLVDFPLDDDVVKVVNHLPTTDPEADAYLSVWEYDRIPEEWAEIFNRATVVMTQSTYCRDVFAAQIEEPSKIHVIPYIIPACYTPEGPRSRLLDEGTFVFGSVFEWVPRKCPERTIQAFTEEFDKDENVRLLIRADAPGGKVLDGLIGEISDDPRIVAMKEPVNDLAAFYRGLNAYTLCTAGEGWSQTLTEAMACGVPTIASRHSGNLDFMNDANSFLVDVHDWSLATDMQGFKWKLPKVSSIRDAFREAFESRNDGSTRRKIENALATCKKFNRERVGKMIFNAIKSLL